MFDSLSEKLQGIIRQATGKELTQDNMQEALREIRRALLEADVNLRVVKAFISNIKDRAEGEKVLQGVDPVQHQQRQFLQPFYGCDWIDALSCRDR